MIVYIIAYYAEYVNTLSKVFLKFFSQFDFIKCNELVKIIKRTVISSRHFAKVGKMV